MIVLRNHIEYLAWVLDEYACDVFTPKEMESIIDEMKPKEYPCIIYSLPQEDIGKINGMMYISYNEIEMWIQMLRTSES